MSQKGTASGTRARPLNYQNLQNLSRPRRGWRTCYPARFILAQPQNEIPFLAESVQNPVRSSNYLAQRWHRKDPICDPREIRSLTG